MSGEIDLLLRTIAAYDMGTVPDRDAFPLGFVDTVRFERWGADRESPADTVDGFDQWFASLRALGIRRLQLAFPGINAPSTLADRRTFGFSNASGGFLVATGPQPERWRALWKVGDRNARDRRIWRITFQGVPHDPHALLPPPPPIAETTAALVAAITAARDVAARGNLTTWVTFFDRADAIGRGRDGDARIDVPGVPELPAGWRSPAATRLLHAARAANGFGAMGSWNDQGFADPALQEAYEQASQQLFVVMLHGLVAGAISA